VIRRDIRKTPVQDATKIACAKFDRYEQRFAMITESWGRWNCGGGGGVSRFIYTTLGAWPIRKFAARVGRMIKAPIWEYEPSSVGLTARRFGADRCSINIGVLRRDGLRFIASSTRQYNKLRTLRDQSTAPTPGTSRSLRPIRYNKSDYGATTISARP
jgi:hypothetical protein